MGISIWQDGKDVTEQYREWIEHTLNNPIFTYAGMEEFVDWIEKKHGIKVSIHEFMKEGDDFGE